MEYRRIRWMSVQVGPKLRCEKHRVVWKINQESHTSASAERQKLLRTCSHTHTHSKSMCKLAWALNSEGTHTGDLPRGAALSIDRRFLHHDVSTHTWTNTLTWHTHTLKLIMQLIGTEAAGNDQSASNNVMIAVSSSPIVLALASSPFPECLHIHHLLPNPPGRLPPLSHAMSLPLPVSDVLTLSLFLPALSHPIATGYHPFILLYWPFSQLTILI